MTDKLAVFITSFRTLRGTQHSLIMMLEKRKRQVTREIASQHRLWIFQKFLML